MSWPSSIWIGRYRFFYTPRASMGLESYKSWLDLTWEWFHGTENTIRVSFRWWLDTPITHRLRIWRHGCLFRATFADGKSRVKLKTFLQYHLDGWIKFTSNLQLPCDFEEKTSSLATPIAPRISQGRQIQKFLSWYTPRKLTNVP